MALERYREKRNFESTPEPAGAKRVVKGPHRFYIQKHAASHLHYDLRIEMEGVLKSWAVPKGPSLNPSVKRLAMMVEDHPLEYGTFEGIIPKGNYGAGTVMLWDEGTLSVPGVTGRKETETALKRMLHEGNIKLNFQGRKIKGEFALVKTKRESGKGNEWLLIKKKDEHSGKLEDITNADKSIRTNRTLEEIKQAEGADKAVWYSPAVKDINLLGAPEKQMPSDIKPMMATLVDEPFSSDDWVFEIKWDGYRAIAEVNYNDVSLYSRNNKPFNDDYPEIVAELVKLGIQAVFDGELVVLDESGHAGFQLIQNYKRTGKGYLAYYIFDILYFNGHDLTGLTLLQRKSILYQVLQGQSGRVRYNDHVSGIGTEFFERAAEKGIEGIIAKREESVYQTGRRSKDWLKIKSVQRQEAVICGFTEPKGSRKKFGALILGLYEGDQLKYIGHAGGGFNEESLEEVYKKLEKIKLSDSPFAARPKTNMPVVWVKPSLVCEVKFQEWTSEGIMRQPIFLGLREDKSAKEVHQEKPDVPAKESSLISEGKGLRKTQRPSVSKTGKIKSPKTVLSDGENQKQQEVILDGINLKFTNLDKVLWPKEGYTKRDLIEYYDKIAEYILPYLQDRPESLRRNPNGIEKHSFFQKDMPETTPEWVQTEKIYSESVDKEINYLVCNSKPALLYLANLGCIELNPWSSRIMKLDFPDYTVIDIDPKDASFEQVIEVALAVKEVTDRAGIKSYPKTSGSRGIHVYIPLGAKYTYDHGKDFAHLIATLTHELVPDLTTLVRTPSKRERPIYLDYLQNRKGQTLAAPYCLRPKPGATVSTPLEWKELKAGLHPSQFTIHTIFERLKEKGDLFRPVLGEGVDLKHAIERLNK